MTLIEFAITATICAILIAVGWGMGVSSLDTAVKTLQRLSQEEQED